MSIFVQPGETFTATTAPGVFATGLVGTVGVRIENGDGTNHTPRTTAGIVEVEPGSTIYAKDDLVAPNAEGTYLALWDNGAGLWAQEELVVTWTPPQAAVAPGPSYTSPTLLRAELQVDAGTLPDDTAALRIADAEDAIDELLGGWPIDETTGRKIVQADVEGWQWAKLQRATTKMAAHLYRTPDLLQQRPWRKMSGPDFAVEGPGGGSATLADVIMPLNQSRLRILSGRAVAGTGRTRYDRFLNATRHDGT